jgi:hypothetical protein
MNLLRLLAFTRIPGNACSFLLRRMIRWSRGKAVFHQEPKDDLFAYLNGGRRDAEVRAAELSLRYDLEPLARLSTRSRYQKNLYLLDSLEKATRGLSLPFRENRGITAMDIGSQEWYYVFALERWLRKHNRSNREPVKLTGIELDAYELCAGFRSRIDYATAYAEQTGNPDVRYVVDDFRKRREQGHDILFLFYPLVLRYQQLLWGLPLHVFDPEGIVAHAAVSTRSCGWLVVFCHTIPEHKIFLDLCRKNGAFTLLREGEALSMLVDFYAKTRDRRFSIWVKT